MDGNIARSRLFLPFFTKAKYFDGQSKNDKLDMTLAISTMFVFIRLDTPNFKYLQFVHVKIPSLSFNSCFTSMFFKFQKGILTKTGEIFSNHPLNIEEKDCLESIFAARKITGPRKFRFAKIRQCEGLMAKLIFIRRKNKPFLYKDFVVILTICNVSSKKKTLQTLC